MERADTLVALLDVPNDLWVAGDARGQGLGPLGPLGAPVDVDDRGIGDNEGLDQGDDNDGADDEGADDGDDNDGADDDFHGCDDCNDIDDAIADIEDVGVDVGEDIADIAEIGAVSEELTADGRATGSLRAAAAGLPARPTVADLMRSRRRALTRR